MYVIDMVEDASADVVLDHVFEPSRVGIKAADCIQNGRPKRFPPNIIPKIYLEL